MYLLSEFEDDVQTKENEATEVLEKFVKYNQIVLDVTTEECFKKLRHCMEQMSYQPVL